MKYNVIVVGSGFAGTTMSERLSTDPSNQILVIDKRNHIAGNMFDFVNEDNILIHKYGPHLFHTNNKKVYNYVLKFGKWYNYEHKVLVNIFDRLIILPFNFNSIDQCYDKQKAKKIKNILINEYGTNHKISILNLLKSTNEEIKQLAIYVYNNIYLNYTMKQWSSSLNEVDSNVLSRVPIHLSSDNRYFQDNYQILPEISYQHIIGNMLQKPNIHLELNTDSSKVIKINNNKIYFNNQEFKGKLFYTGSIDELLAYKYGELPYRSLVFKSTTIGQELFQPVAIVNYPNRETRFTRITEYKHFALTKYNFDKTTIVKEYPCAYKRNKNVPYYPIEISKNISLYNKYAKKLSTVDNLYLIGRLAEYKYYNMDEVISKALNLYEVVKKIPSKVSIIVPIYNMEQYIKACFDSLLKQTFKEIEIWAINDGSTDNSHQIIEEIAEKDNRVRVINKANGGYGSVLELAIKNITTDYFIICDPDDYMEPNAVEVLYKTAVANKVDLVYGKFYHVNETGVKSPVEFSTFFGPIANKIYNQELDRFVFLPVSPHAKLYKTAIVKGLSFPLKTNYTDALLYYFALSKANNLFFVNEYLANYYINRLGNTHTDENPNIFKSYKVVADNIVKQVDLRKHKYAVFGLFLYNWYVLIKLSYQTAGIRKNKVHYLYKMYQNLMPYSSLLDEIPEFNLDLKNFKNEILDISTYQITINKMLDNSVETEKLFFDEVAKLNDTSQID